MLNAIKKIVLLTLCGLYHGLDSSPLPKICYVVCNVLSCQSDNMLSKWKSLKLRYVDSMFRILLKP